ncbi:hypothetical protein ABIB15_002532 [Marisediminicola sp. UYEF4]|uniref:hypothetical protein n=1 Tax=Marisediminicola sp. UYEF4 TaxID=1756384 RepID=UPI0033979790
MSKNPLLALCLIALLALTGCSADSDAAPPAPATSEEAVAEIEPEAEEGQTEMTIEEAGE